MAGFQDAPVMLVKGPAPATSCPTRCWPSWTGASPDQVFILGGTAAVSQDVEDELNLSYPGWATD